MKNRKVKLMAILLISILVLSMIPVISKAAGSFNASISKTTVTVGDTFTVTAKATSSAGMYTVSASNSNVSITSKGSGFLDNSSETWTFKANKAGTVTITAKATDMTDAEDDTKSITGSKSFTVTIKEKSSTNSDQNNSSASQTEKPTFTSTNRTVYTTGNVNLRSSWSTSSAATQVAKGTELKLTGTSNKVVNGYTWYRVEYNGATKYIASSLVTSTKPKEEEPDEKDEKSDNNNLSALTISGITLTPAFQKDVLQYTATVSKDITKLEVNAKAEDSKSQVKIQGNEDLKDGENTIKIVVTAEDSTTKTYTVKVTKGEESTGGNTTPNSSAELKLEELKIAGVNFENGFNPDIYNYEMPLNSAVEKLDITAKANQEGAKVEIIGNHDFKPGENLITILLTSADETQTVTYQVKVTVPEGQVINPQNNNKMYIICGGAIGISILLIIIIIVTTLRKDKEEQIEELEIEENKMQEEVRKEEKIEEEKLAEVTEEHKPTLDEFLDTSEIDEKPRTSRGKHSM
ncbi:MAG: hypothetical protein HFJ28_06475 [Clostridia bacterium]|jgi:hypothetical protein|nr:hypothetical protein [Clostridia bacterium]